MKMFERASIPGLVLLGVMLASRPAVAQISLVGDWNPRFHEDQPDRIPGPELGDFTGLPITPGARLAAESWDASRLTLKEHQCKVHIGPYIYHDHSRCGSPRSEIRKHNN